MLPLNEDQQAMAETALARANEIAARYARVFPRHADDLVSSAVWGVVKAATTWTTDGGVRWDNWAANQSKQECQRFLGRKDTMREIPFGENFRDGEPVAVAAEFNDDMDTLLAGLPETHRALCIKVYREDTTIEAAAVSLGFSPKHGHKLHRQALEILRKRMSA